MTHGNGYEVAIITSIVAGIVLAVFANWVYDILRMKKFLPNNPTLKIFLYLSLGSIPFVFFVALPELALFKQDRATPDVNVIENTENDGHTQVTEYIPDLPSKTRIGQCWTSSLTLSRSTAWRCMIADEIYDPCFELINPFDVRVNSKVVCNADPYNSDESFLVELEQALPEPDSYAKNSLDNKEPDNAWILELSDGRLCYFNTGATAARYERLNYFCDSRNSGEDTFVMGLPTIGAQWKAYTVVLSQNKDLIKNEWVSINRVWR